MEAGLCRCTDGATEDRWGGGGVGGWGGEGVGGKEAEAAGGLRDALSLHAHLYPDFLLHFLPLLHLEGL